jgi:hypothetical protein
MNPLEDAVSEPAKSVVKVRVTPLIIDVTVTGALKSVLTLPKLAPAFDDDNCLITRASRS